jgi:hypothetical protein
MSTSRSPPCAFVRNAERLSNSLPSTSSCVSEQYLAARVIVIGHNFGQRSCSRRGYEIFVYKGEQVVPDGVRRVRIDESVKIIPARAFLFRRLINVEFHDRVERIKRGAFANCFPLRLIKLLGVKVIEREAFCSCTDLSEVEFGDKLETIEQRAFLHCTSLRNNCAIC